MILQALTVITRGLLALRYRVRVKGLRDVLAGRRRGVLFLPNHPALIDPVILLAHLWPYFRMRALADRRQTDRFFIRRVVGWLGAIRIDDITRDGSDARENVRDALDRCGGILREGGNLLLYPSGRAYRSRYERVGGSQAVETLLRLAPETRIVLVRTTGLWGSRFSRAWGTEPNVGRALGAGLQGLLASGLFFAPRRDVTVELLEPDDFPRNGTLREINRYLEEFYNAQAPPARYVPYSMWEADGARTMPEPRKPSGRADVRTVRDTTRQAVRQRLAEMTGRAEVAPSESLAADLGLDSLAMADLAAWLAEEFGAGVHDIDSLRSVGDVMLLADGEAGSAGQRSLEAVPDAWKLSQDPCVLEDPGGMSIPAAMLAQARRRADQAILADQISGVLTYRTVIRACFALRDDFSALPGLRVGLMFPASVGAAVCYMALLLAGKVPAMINWTLGRRNLAHTLDLADVRAVLTPEALLSRLRGQGVDLQPLENRLVTVEAIRAGLGLGRKLRAAAGARFSWRALQDAADAMAPDTEAAVLFTSGSEARPKAVPLSHRNMLTNVADAMGCFDLRKRDTLLGILPPFHSFGLTTSVVLPFATGLRVAYWPDPTDGATIGRMIDAYGTTLLATTPTFLGGVVRSSDPAELKSLRLVVSGAERCPPRLYDAIRQSCPQAVVMEGYGASECSPIIAVNREWDARAGTVGPVVPSLEYAIVDAERLEPVTAGEEGLLLVRGPSVFGGYLGADAPEAFLRYRDEQWYDTGDRVREDADGYLHFAGRMKRFVKRGGEMISLPAIEAALTDALAKRIDPEEGPALAVLARGEEKPELILATRLHIDRAEANDAIRAAGLSGLHAVQRVETMHDLPLLGTGKVDYQTLESTLPE